VDTHHRLLLWWVSKFSLDCPENVRDIHLAALSDQRQRLFQRERFGQAVRKHLYHKLNCDIKRIWTPAKDAKKGGCPRFSEYEDEQSEKWKLED
jgi:hypothetical protein